MSVVANVIALASIVFALFVIWEVWRESKRSRAKRSKHDAEVCRLPLDHDGSCEWERI